MPVAPLYLKSPAPNLLGGISTPFLVNVLHFINSAPFSLSHQTGCHVFIIYLFFSSLFCAIICFP